MSNKVQQAGLISTMPHFVMSCGGTAIGAKLTAYIIKSQKTKWQLSTQALAPAIGLSQCLQGLTSVAPPRTWALLPVVTC